MKLYNTYGDLLIDYKDCLKMKDVVEKAIVNDIESRGAYLPNANLAHANLIDINLINANLSRANLTGANLTGANLNGAIFSRAKMTGAILPLNNYDVPNIVDIHKKVYEACSVKETFDMRTWCKTAKCIAGWVCTIAGKRGLALAKEIGFDAAASLIYMQSDPKLERLPDYYASNEEALRYLKMLANK